MIWAHVFNRVTLFFFANHKGGQKEGERERDNGAAPKNMLFKWGNCVCVQVHARAARDAEREGAPSPHTPRASKNAGAARIKGEGARGGGQS